MNKIKEVACSCLTSCDTEVCGSTSSPINCYQHKLESNLKTERNVHTKALISSSYSDRTVGESLLRKYMF